MSILSDVLRPFVNAVTGTRSPEYDAVGSTRRTTNWNPSGSGPNASTRSSHTDLVRRSRDAIRRNDWAVSASETHVSNVIGTGITPRPQGDEEFVERVRELWNQWVSECDADGVNNFYGLQALVARARFEGGDCFVRYRPRRASDGLIVPLQLQTFETEQVDHSLNESRTNGEIINGIEFDRIGKRTAYHMWRTHPSDGSMLLQGVERVAVPADQIIHVYRPTRPGQVRGLPEISHALLTLHDLDEVKDARVMREKIQNLFVAFLTKMDPGATPFGQVGTSHDDVPLAALEPGTVQELLPGENVTMSSPPNEGPQQDTFFRVHIQALATSLGLTYEQLTGDLTGVNFSSIRAGLIEVRRRFEMVQEQVMVHMLCRPVYARFIETAMLSGALPVPSDFRSRPHFYLTAQWHADAFEFVQPIDDINAVIKKIRAGLMSRAQAASELGYDVEVIDEQMKLEQERAEALGLEFPELAGASAADGSGRDADGDGQINEGNAA